MPYPPDSPKARLAKVSVGAASLVGAALDARDGNSLYFPVGFRVRLSSSLCPPKSIERVMSAPPGGQPWPAGGELESVLSSESSAKVLDLDALTVVCIIITMG